MNNKLIPSVPVLLILALFLFLGCTSGTSTNLNTGQQTKNVGLSFDETYLSVNDTKLNTNEVTLGDIVKLNFIGLTGFNEVDGKIYPGMSMDVTDSNGGSILSLPNMTSDYSLNGTNPNTIFEKISLSLTTGLPMEVGQTYQVKIAMWDTKAASSYLESTVNITMK